MYQYTLIRVADQCDVLLLTCIRYSHLDWWKSEDPGNSDFDCDSDSATKNLKDFLMKSQFGGWNMWNHDRGPWHGTQVIENVKALKQKSEFEQAVRKVELYRE